MRSAPLRSAGMVLVMTGLWMTLHSVARFIEPDSCVGASCDADAARTGTRGLFEQPLAAAAGIALSALGIVVSRRTRRETDDTARRRGRLPERRRKP